MLSAKDTANPNLSDGNNPDNSKLQIEPNSGLPNDPDDDSPNKILELGNMATTEQRDNYDRQSIKQLMLMKIDDFGNNTGRVAGVTHNSTSQMTATKYNYEQDHFFEGTP